MTKIFQNRQLLLLFLITILIFVSFIIPLRIVLTFLIMIITLIIIPYWERSSKNKKVFYISLTCGILIIILSGSSEISNYRKDKKLKLLEEQELILRDFKISVNCKFYLKNEPKKRIHIERGSELFGFLSGTFNLNMISIESDTLIIKGKSLNIELFKSDLLYPKITMNNNAKTLIDYTGDKTAIVRIDFILFDTDEIINKKIKDLEDYNCFYLPYKNILKVVPKNKQNRVTISYQIIINGSLFLEYHMDYRGGITLNEFTEYIPLFYPKGMFKNVENRYLKISG